MSITTTYYTEQSRIAFLLWSRGDITYDQMTAAMTTERTTTMTTSTTDLARNALVTALWDGGRVTFSDIQNEECTRIDALLAEVHDLMEQGESADDAARVVAEGFLEGEL